MIPKGFTSGAAFEIRDIRLNYKPVCQAFYSTELRVIPIANTEPLYNGRSSYTTTTDAPRNREKRKWQMHNTEKEVIRNSNIVKWEGYITLFYVHGSVHRESMSIIVQQDATIYSSLYFCELLYMFRVVTPPNIRSTYNCNYSIWHWSNRLGYLPLWWRRWNFQLLHHSGR